jgi:hypothetical protein
MKCSGRTCSLQWLQYRSMRRCAAPVDDLVADGLRRKLRLSSLSELRESKSREVQRVVPGNKEVRKPRDRKARITMHRWDV